MGVVRQEVKRSAGRSGFMGSSSLASQAASWMQFFMEGGRGIWASGWLGLMAATWTHKAENQRSGQDGSLLRPVTLEHEAARQHDLLAVFNLHLSVLLPQDESNAEGGDSVRRKERKEQPEVQQKHEGSTHTHTGEELHPHTHL